MDPKFTIVTPVLNMADFIGRCITSVQNQNVSLEHIIVDGGSTDGTLEITNELKNDRTVVISEADDGQSDAINKGLKIAKGELFNWLNADDEFEEGALDLVQNSFSPGVDVVAGSCTHIENGQELAIGITRIESSSEKTLANYQMGQPSHFYRTQQIKDLAGLNTNLELAMDMDLWIRFVLKHGTKNCVALNQRLSRFHLHPKSKSVEQSQRTDQAKYGMFLSLLKGIDAPKWIADEVVPLAMELDLNYNCAGLDKVVFINEFAYRLMLFAYERGDNQTASKLYGLVEKSDRLTNSEKLEWRARTLGATAKLIKTLRGK